MKRLGSFAALIAAAALGTVTTSAVTLAQSRGLAPAEANVLRSMSDANILGHLASVDSFEIVLSDSAIAKSKSDTVLGFAKAMRTAHLASRTGTRLLGRELNLPLTTIAGEMRKTHMFAPADSVVNASEMKIDAHYLRQQVEMHDHMLAELPVLASAAKNERIRQQVMMRIPAVRAHLDYARSVAKAKGVEVPAP